MLDNYCSVPTKVEETLVQIALNDPDHYVRFWALLELRSMGGEKAIAELRKAKLLPPSRLPTPENSYVTIDKYYRYTEMKQWVTLTIKALENRKRNSTQALLEEQRGEKDY